MTCFLAWIVTTILVTYPEPPQGPMDPDSKALFERLVKEAPQGWAELEAKCQKVRFSGRFHKSGNSRLPDGGSLENSLSTQVEFKLNGPEHLSWKNEDPVRDGKQATFGSSTTVVANPQYTFVAKRPNANSLFFLEERNPLAESKVVTQMLNSKRYMFLTMMWGNSGSTPYRELLGLKTFHLKKISKVREDGADRIKVEYDRDADPTAKTVAIHDAWAVFDPDAHWITTEFGYTLPTGLQYFHEYKYDKDENHFPILQVSTYKISGGEERSVFQLDFRSFEYAEVPLGEFYTPFFGFEEPGEPAMPSGSISWSFLLLLIGGLFVFLAIILRLRPTVSKMRAQLPPPGHAM